MTHYWYLICAGQEIDETTKFFRVGVTQSHQGDRDFLFLTAFAESHNYFFHMDSLAVSDYVMKCVKSLTLDGGKPDFVTNKIQVVKARDLVRAIKASEALPLSQAQLANFNHEAHFLSLNYRIFSNLNRRSHSPA